MQNHSDGTDLRMASVSFPTNGTKFREKCGLHYGSNKYTCTAIGCNYDSEFHLFNCSELQSRKHNYIQLL